MSRALAFFRGGMATHTPYPDRLLTFKNLPGSMYLHLAMLDTILYHPIAQTITAPTYLYLSIPTRPSLFQNPTFLKPHSVSTPLTGFSTQVFTKQSWKYKHEDEKRGY